MGQRYTMVITPMVPRHLVHIRLAENLNTKLRNTTLINLPRVDLQGFSEIKIKTWGVGWSCTWNEIFILQ